MPRGKSTNKKKGKMTEEKGRKSRRGSAATKKKEEPRLKLEEKSLMQAREYLKYHKPRERKTKKNALKNFKKMLKESKARSKNYREV